MKYLVTYEDIERNEFNWDLEYNFSNGESTQRITRYKPFNNKREAILFCEKDDIRDKNPNIYKCAKQPMKRIVVNTDVSPTRTIQ